MAPKTRLGFTLLELLIVISIITLLIGLLLPAIHYVRAASRRLKCQNHLKQLGVCMHQYHELNRSFPPGFINYGGVPTTAAPDPLTPWLPMILPGIEQNELYDQFNFDLGFVGADAEGLTCNETVHRTHISMMICPTQAASMQEETASPYVRAKGNYAVNWGNTTWWQVSLPDHPFRKAPFGVNSRIGFHDIVDGASQTMLMSELVSTINGDLRGDMWNHDAGASNFYTTATPNSTVPDKLGTPWCETAGNPPCVNVPEDRQIAYAAARSLHSGGVHVLYVDGSVAFVSDSIELKVWQAQGSIAGGDDAF